MTTPRISTKEFNLCTRKEFTQGLERLAHDGDWDTASGRQVLEWMRELAAATVHRLHRNEVGSSHGYVSELQADAWEFIESRGPRELSRESNPLGLVVRVMERSLWKMWTADAYLTDKSKASKSARFESQIGSKPYRFDDALHIENHVLQEDSPPDPRTETRKAVHAAVKTLIDGLVDAGMAHERATRVVRRAWEIMECHSRASQRIHTTAYADPELCADLGQRQIRALIDLMCGPRRTPDGTSALAVVIEAELSRNPISIESATLTARRDLAVLAGTAGDKSIGRAA